LDTPTNTIEFIFSANENWCQVTVRNPEYRYDSCGNFMDHLLDGYNIEKNMSGLANLSKTELHKQLSSWTLDPDNSPQCIFYMYVCRQFMCPMPVMCPIKASCAFHNYSSAGTVLCYSGHLLMLISTTSFIFRVICYVLI
jgi:hypothetical protein